MNVVVYLWFIILTRCSGLVLWQKASYRTWDRCWLTLGGWRMERRTSTSPTVGAETHVSSQLWMLNKKTRRQSSRTWFLYTLSNSLPLKVALSVFWWKDFLFALLMEGFCLDSILFADFTSMCTKNHSRFCVRELYCLYMVTKGI